MGNILFNTGRNAEKGIEPPELTDEELEQFYY